MFTHTYFQDCLLSGCAAIFRVSQEQGFFLIPDGEQVAAGMRRAWQLWNVLLPGLRRAFASIESEVGAPFFLRQAFYGQRQKQDVGTVPNG